MLLDESLGLIEGAVHPVLIGHGVTGERVTKEGSVSFPPPSSHHDLLHDVDNLPDPFIGVNPHGQALQQLISRSVPQDKLPSFIETIFSDKKTINMMGCLQEGDAQAFIDAVDVVRHHTL